MWSVPTFVVVDFVDLRLPIIVDFVDLKLPIIVDLIADFVGLKFVSIDLIVLKYSF